MIARVLGTITGARSWLLLALLLPRAAGFITGVLLARFAGPAALGLYSTVLNTASSVIGPVAQPLINNATLMAAEAAGRPLRGLWRAQLLMLTAVLALALPLFALLFGRAVDPALLEPSLWALALLAATAVVLSQLGNPLVAALLHGEGRFRAAGQWTTLAALATLIAVVPAVLTGRLAGALLLVAASALLGFVLLSADLLRRHDGEAPTATPWREALGRLRAAAPSIAATGLNAAVNWLCTIYLIHMHWGAAGVGVFGIALQWSTLMQMPATSWGGMTLQQLGEARVRGGKPAVLAVLRSQLGHNLAVSALAGLAVFVTAGWIEQLYGLRASGLPAVLAAFAAVAVVNAANIVFERLWWTAGRQQAWFAWNCVALAVQLALTLWLLPTHLAFAGVGVLSAGLILAACSVLALPAYLRSLPAAEAAP